MTGGSYRYTAWQDGEEVAAFFGSFHEVRPSERLVQTFTWEGMPDGVSLETMTFTDLGDGRTRVTSVSVVDCFEGSRRDHGQRHGGRRLSRATPSWTRCSPRTVKRFAS